MSLSDLASLGSFVSGIAVAVTLIFFVLQLRHNAAALRRAEVNATQSEASSYRMAVVASRDVAKLVAEGVAENGTLDAIDDMRFRYFLSEFMWVRQHIWDRQEMGLMDKGSWEGASGVIDILASRRGALWWQTNKSAYSPGFRAVVDKATATAKQPNA
jgi:hypothetical protein